MHVSQLLRFGYLQTLYIILKFKLKRDCFKTEGKNRDALQNTDVGTGLPGSDLQVAAELEALQASPKR